MVEAETNLSQLPLREAISLVARRLEYAEEYARVWIIREAAGDRIKAQGKTPEWWDVSILPAAWRGMIDSDQAMACGRTLLLVTSVGVIDRDTDTLWFPWQPWGISNVELCLDGLVTAALLPTPKDNATEREGWWASQLFAWMIGGEPSKLTPEMGPKILPARRELTRKIGAGLMTPWDMSDEPKQVGRTAIVNVHGEWTNSEGSRGSCIVFYADQGQRVFPRLDWMREEAERSAAEVRAELPKLNNLIALDETNRTDWTRFVELIATIGGNLENLTPDEAAVVRLVNRFSSVRAKAELRSSLYDEAEKIRRRIGDRIVAAVRAGRLEVKGRNGPGLKVVEIPASLVTANEIWSWLRSGEMTIYGQCYVDVTISSPNRRAGRLSGKDKATPKPRRRPAVDPVIEALESRFPPRGDAPRHLSSEAVLRMLELHRPDLEDVVSSKSVGRALKVIRQRLPE
jgi:hypothetical protein